MSTLRGQRSESERALLEKGFHVYLSENPNPQYVIKSTYYSDGSQITTICDGSSGFNVVSYERVNANLEPLHTRKVRFRETDGIFVPDAVELSYYDEDKPNPQLKIKRKFELESIEVNKPLPQSTFEFEQFGVRYGERMLDTIKNQLLVYDGSQRFVPAQEFELDPSQLPADHPRASRIPVPADSGRK